MFMINTVDFPLGQADKDNREEERYGTHKLFFKSNIVGIEGLHETASFQGWI